MSNPKKIVVFGLGAAGSNFLLNMSYAHPDLSYVGVDFDIVEQRNFTAGTQPYSKIDVNRPKTQAMQRIVRDATGVKVEGIKSKIEDWGSIVGIAGSQKFGETLMLVDCFDNAESRNLFLKVKGRYPVLHVGFSPTMVGEAIWDDSWGKMESFDKGAFDICQARVARPFIQALTSIATLVASDFIETGNKRSVFFDSRLKLMVF